MGEIATVLCPVGGHNAAVRGQQPPLPPPFSSTLWSFEPLKVRSNVRMGYGPDEWRAPALPTKVYPSPQLSIGRRAPTWDERAIDRWPTSHGRMPSEQERTKAFSGHTKSLGAHTEAPSTEAFSGRTESVSYVEMGLGIEAHGIRQGRQKSRFLGDHQKPRLLVSFRSNAGEAVGDANPHEGVSQTGFEVEVKTVSAGGLCPSNENEEASRSKLGTGREATGVNDVVLPVPEQEGVNGPSRQQKGSGKHVVDIWKDTSQKSVEEALGLLKEQVEEDKRKLLASEKGVAALVIADNRKPLKRPRVIAKQLISRSSARAIGFVSQMWCKVVALDVRPSLLSGEIDGVLRGDVFQVGDAILASDESALENEMMALDCETLGTETWQDDRRRAGFLEYEALKRELSLLTAAIAAFCTVYCGLVISFEASLSYGIGALGSLLYLNLLSRHVDKISEENVAEVFLRRREKKIGIRSSDIQDSFEKVFFGSGLALSSPRLVIPASLYGLWTLLHRFSDMQLNLEIAPLMFGFFAYKAALLVQAYRENKDLAMSFEKENRNTLGR